jgi:hypothetical protein
MPNPLPVPVILALAKAIQENTLVFHDKTVHHIGPLPRTEKVYHGGHGTMFIPLEWKQVDQVWFAPYPGGLFFDYKP